VACLVKGNKVPARIVSAQTEMNQLPGNCRDYMLHIVIMRMVMIKRITNLRDGRGSQ
jgi:hypothetical protein